MTSQSMPRHVVGIDIETTDLDPASGEIIEVAAIRFDTKTGKETDRFERLCHPSKPIGQFTTGITGITQAMVAGKRPFKEHILALESFVGSDHIFAHNANFDISWLAHHGLPLSNPVWDTFALAAIAWPEAPTYNLGSLARDLGIEIAGEHRAAADIFLTWHLLQAMLPQLSVPARDFPILEHALDAAGEADYIQLFKKVPEEKSPPHPASPARTPRLDHRPEQEEMADYIASLIDRKRSALIEAPTGIGKTIAYLKPAILSNKPIVVSTFTKTLQDQLVESDIPDMMSSLKQSRKVAVMKGRRNYVCTRQLYKLLAKPPRKPEDIWPLIKILVWLGGGGSGDLERLNFSHQGRHIVNLVSADSLVCRLECREGTCLYANARAAARKADILVVNHSLLLYAAEGGDSGSLIRNDSVLIVDEAHHLEEAALSASRIDLSLESIGDLTAVLSRINPGNLLLKKEVAPLIKQYQAFLEAAGRCVDQHTKNSELPLNQMTRSSSSWAAAQRLGNQFLSRLRFTIGLLQNEEGSHSKHKKELYEDTNRKSNELSISLEQFLIGSTGRVQWLEKRPRDRIASLNDVACDISPYIQPLIAAHPTVVLTSATLTTQGGFSYIKSRFGLKDVEEKVCSSSFNYADQMLIMGVEDGPLPNSSTFDAHLSKVILEVAKQTRGRMLCLFTSHASLRSTYEKTSKELNKDNISIFAQKVTGGRYNIAKRFRDQEDSVLFGTSSFWEGISVPGESLSVVIIPRLPFPRVNDPIIESLARSVGPERSFKEIMIPRMLLRLRQGIGRLLRNHNDRGVIIILDKRLVVQSYGLEIQQTFPVPIQVESSAQVAEKVAEWFGPATITRWHRTSFSADSEK